MRMAMPRSSGQVARSGFTGGGLSVHREREHEHAARLPETGHGELARADEPPGRGQRLELLFGPAALHGEKAAVRGDQPPRLREQLRQRCERARDDRVEGFGRVHRLDSRLKRRHVREPERLRRVRREADLLGGRVDESEMPRGICDRKRQPRKSRAGADVRDARALEVGVDGEAVEKVMSHHGAERADACEVVAAVPPGGPPPGGGRPPPPAPRPAHTPAGPPPPPRPPRPPAPPPPTKPPPPPPPRPG